jgi:hypothetical protein
LEPPDAVPFLQKKRPMQWAPGSYEEMREGLFLCQPRLATAIHYNKMDIVGRIRAGE